MASIARIPSSTPEAKHNLILAFGLLALVVGILTPRDQREQLLAELMGSLLAVPPDAASGWFLRAEGLRLSGLHLDWEGSRWRSPAAISDADLADARRNVRPIVASIVGGVRSIARTQERLPR